MALGDEQNTGRVNVPGTYKDPESGKELTVTMHAGADALVRLGWELQSEAPAVASAPEPDATPLPEELPAPEAVAPAKTKT